MKNDLYSSLGELIELKNRKKVDEKIVDDTQARIWAEDREKYY